MAQDGSDVRDAERADRALLNRRVAVLTERVWYSHDPDAGVELGAIFERTIRPLAWKASQTYFRNEQRTYVKSMLSHAFTVAKKALDGGVTMPLDYVERSLRNLHVSEMQKAQTRWRCEHSLPEEGRTSLRSEALPVDADLVDRDIQRTLREWQQGLVESRERVKALAARVVEVCYLTGESQSDVYELLELDEADRTSVAQCLARMRKDPNAKFAQLLTLLIDEGETLQDPRKRREGGSDER